MAGPIVFRLDVVRYVATAGDATPNEVIPDDMAAASLKMHWSSLLVTVSSTWIPIKCEPILPNFTR